MAEKDLVVVHADGVVSGRVVAEEGSTERECVLGAPAGECCGDVVVQGWMLAEFVLVPWLVVCLESEIDEVVGDGRMWAGWTAVGIGDSCADSGVVQRISVGIEDAIDGLSIGS